MRNFSSNKNFTSYIVKCFAESYVRKEKISKRKYRHIRGCVSLDEIASHFQICVNTVISSLKRSKARKRENIREYRQYQFKSKREYANWLLNNMNLEIGFKKISDNPRAFYPRRINNSNKYCLAETLPNVYLSTSARLSGQNKRALK